MLDRAKAGNFLFSFCVESIWTGLFPPSPRRDLAMMKVWVRGGSWEVEGGIFHCGCHGKQGVNARCEVAFYILVTL